MAGATSFSTLSAVIPIKSPLCRRVSVPAPGWVSSSRAYPLPRRPRLPGQAGFTKSNMTALKRGRALLLRLLCAEAGWLILVNVGLRLERAYLKLRLVLRV